MMNKKAIEYTAKALDFRIKRLGESLEQKKEARKHWEWELKHKRSLPTSQGAFGLVVEYDESTASRCHKELDEWIKKQQPHYDEYVQAREAFRKEYGV